MFIVGKLESFKKAWRRKYITHNPITQRQPLLITAMIFFQIFLHDDFYVVNSFEVCLLENVHANLGIFPWHKKLCKREKL